MKRAGDLGRGDVILHNGVRRVVEGVTHGSCIGPRHRDTVLIHFAAGPPASYAATYIPRAVTA